MCSNCRASDRKKQFLSFFRDHFQPEYFTAKQRQLSRSYRMDFLQVYQKKVCEKVVWYKQCSCVHNDGLGVGKYISCAITLQCQKSLVYSVLSVVHNSTTGNNHHNIHNKTQTGQQCKLHYGLGRKVVCWFWYILQKGVLVNLIITYFHVKTSLGVGAHDWHSRSTWKSLETRGCPVEAVRHFCFNDATKCLPRVPKNKLTPSLSSGSLVQKKRSGKKLRLRKLQKLIYDT